MSNKRTSERRITSPDEQDLNLGHPMTLRQRILSSISTLRLAVPSRKPTPQHAPVDRLKTSNSDLMFSHCKHHDYTRRHATRQGRAPDVDIPILSEPNRQCPCDSDTD